MRSTYQRRQNRLRFSTRKSEKNLTSPSLRVSRLDSARYEYKNMTFNEALTFLNQNSGALTVLFTAIVTLSTVVYAILTALLVSETRRMRLVQTEPKIQIQLKSLDFSINLIRLDIENIGLGPAKNVNFKWKAISGGEGAQKLLEEFTGTNFLKTGLSYFGPGQKIHSRCTSMLEDHKEKIECVLEFDVLFKNDSGKKYHEKFLIDVSEMDGMQQIGKPNLYSIAESLKSIDALLGHLTTGFKKMKIDVFTNNDREREYKEALKQIEESKIDEKLS